MKYVSFQNNGVIDMRAVKTFGASAKETENPIGYFGTGLKYAIAVLLRNGCTVELYEGEKRHTFGTKKVNMRRSEFDIITMDDEELGYTTELGKNWEVWQAFRELYCNATDEPDSLIANKRLDPSADVTTIVVTGMPILQAWDERRSIILTEKPHWESKGVEIGSRPSSLLFYRGIRVRNLLPAAAAFTYNVVGHQLRLTEDRTLDGTWLYRELVARAITNSDDEKLIHAVLTASKGLFENDLDFTYVSADEFSKTFLDVMGRLDFGKLTNKTAIKAYERIRGLSCIKTIEERQLQPVEREMLNRAREYCSDLLGSHVLTSYPIFVSDDLDDNTMGMADRARGCVYLARRTFTRGTKQLAGTLFEELVHLKHNLDDETYGLQNFLVDQLMSTYERVLGRPL